MKRLVLLMLLCSTIAYSQQEPQFSQFQNNRLLFNPAYAGMNGMLCFGSNYRTQWTGFPGAPKTFTAWMNTRAPRLGGGIAMHFTHDQLGLEKNTRILGMYSRHFEIFSGKLGIGIAGNIQQKSMNGVWIAPDGTSGDQSIPSPASKDWMAGMDLGVWYHASRLYLGLSSTQLTQGLFKDGPVSYKTARHYFVNAGFRWTPSFLRNIELRNHLLAKSDGKLTAFDIQSQVWLMEQFYLGAGYRPGDAAILMAGVRWGNILFGYSYDITLSNIQHHSSNTHELSVRYCHPITIKVKGKSIQNPRFMWGDRFSKKNDTEYISKSKFNTDW